MRKSEQVKSKQNIKVNFGRTESLCGYVANLVSYDEYPNKIYVSYSLYNDSHFSGGINSTNSLLENAPTHIQDLVKNLKIS